MKYIKILGLAAIAATALMAFVGAGTAMAEKGTLCTVNTTPCPSKLASNETIHFTQKSGTSSRLTNAADGSTLVTCSTSTLHGDLTANPGPTGTAEGKITSLIWGTAATPCSATTTTVAVGTIKVKGTGGGNGELIATSTSSVTVVIFGVSCTYSAEAGTVLGPVTGGEPAMFTANASVKLTAGSTFLCPANGVWDGEYVLTSPSKAWVTAS